MMKACSKCRERLFIGFARPGVTLPFLLNAFPMHMPFTLSLCFCKMHFHVLADLELMHVRNTVLSILPLYRKYGNGSCASSIDLPQAAFATC